MAPVFDVCTVVHKRRGRRTLGWGLLALALATVGAPGVTAASGVPATAELRDASGALLGTATLWQIRDGVRVDATLRGMAPGSHAAHIHDVGRCDPPAFASAAARYGPLMSQNGPSRMEAHRVGDLLNVDDARLGSNFRAVNGVLTIRGLARGASLGPGRDALLGPSGAAVLVHAQRDDDVHDTVGEAGGRIACGVVVSAGSSGASADAVPARALPVAQDGTSLQGEPPEVQDWFRAAYGERASQEWVRQHDAALASSSASKLAFEVPETTAESNVAASDCPEPSSDPATACLLPDHAAVSGSAANVGGIVVYRFAVSWPQATVHAQLVNLATDYDLYLVDDAREVIGQSVQEGTTPETIDMDLPTGMYLLYVNADIGRPMPAKAPYQLLLQVDPQSDLAS